MQRSQAKHVDMKVSKRILILKIYFNSVPSSIFEVPFNKRKTKLTDCAEIQMYCELFLFSLEDTLSEIYYAYWIRVLL